MRQLMQKYRMTPIRLAGALVAIIITLNSQAQEVKNNLPNESTSNLNAAELQNKRMKMIERMLSNQTHTNSSVSRINETRLSDSLISSKHEQEILNSSFNTTENDENNQMPLNNSLTNQNNEEKLPGVYLKECSTNTVRLDYTSLDRYIDASKKLNTEYTTILQEIRRGRITKNEASHLLKIVKNKNLKLISDFQGRIYEACGRHGRMAEIAKLINARLTAITQIKEAIS